MLGVSTWCRELIYTLCMLAFLVVSVGMLSLTTHISYTIDESFVRWLSVILFGFRRWTGRYVVWNDSFAHRIAGDWYLNCTTLDIYT